MMMMMMMVMMMMVMMMIVMMMMVMVSKGLSLKQIIVYRLLQVIGVHIGNSNSAHGRNGRPQVRL